MLATGRRPRTDVVHEQDVYVWHPRMLGKPEDPTVVGNVRSVIYYTSAVGDEIRIEQLSDSIRSLEYRCADGAISRTGHVVAKGLSKRIEDYVAFRPGLWRTWPHFDEWTWRVFVVTKAVAGTSLVQLFSQ